MLIETQNQKDIEQIVAIFRLNYTSKDTGLTPRILNDWSAKGLLNNFRESTPQWHRFSLVDLVEIRVYQELRAFGFSVDKLQEIKQILNSPVIGEAGELDTLVVGGLKTEYTLNNLSMNVILALLGQNRFYVTDICVQQSRFLDSAGAANIFLGDQQETNFIYGKGNCSVVIVDLGKILDHLNIKRIIPDFGRSSQLLSALFRGKSDKSFSISSNVGKIDQFSFSERKSKVNIGDISNVNLRELIGLHKNKTMHIHINEKGAISGIEIE